MRFAWKKNDLAKMKNDLGHFKKNDIVRVKDVYSYREIWINSTNHRQYNPTARSVSEDVLLLPWEQNP